MTAVSSTTRAQREQKMVELDQQYGADEDRVMREFTRWRVRHDTFWFGSKFLGMGSGMENGKHRVDPVFHGWVCDELNAPGSCMILLPRDHMKSSWVAVWCAQQVLIDPARCRIAIFSKAENVARRMISTIVDHLTRDDTLELFGDLIPHPGTPATFSSWETKTTSQFCAQRFPDGRAHDDYRPGEPQVQAWGIGKSLTGMHFDVAVLDDIIDEQNVTTPEEIVKSKLWLSYALPKLSPGGKLVVVGTRYHYNDVYQTILDSADEAGEAEPIVDRIVMRSAVELPGVPEAVPPEMLDDDRTVPIYSFYTKQMLRRTRLNMYRTSGSNVVFNSQYFMNPTGVEDRPFPPPQPIYGERMTADRLASGEVPKAAAEELPTGDYKYFMAVDQAMKAKSTSDQTAIVVAAIDQRGYIYYLHAEGMIARPEEVCRRIIALCDHQYHISRIGFEENAFEHYQYIVAREWEDYQITEQRRVRQPEIMEVKVDRRKTKAQRVNTRLGAYVRSRRVAIHWTLTELMEQMDLFPHGGYDDLVDGADIIVEVAHEFTGAHLQSIYHRPKPLLTVREFINARRKRKQKSGWRGQFAS